MRNSQKLIEYISKVKPNDGFSIVSVNPWLLLSSFFRDMSKYILLCADNPRQNGNLGRPIWYNKNIFWLQAFGKVLLRRYALIYVQFDRKDFAIKYMLLGQNQIQLINKDETQIAHLLIPGADKEWFVNDINIRYHILENKYSIQVPKVISYDDIGKYYISEYIKGSAINNMNDIYYNKIVAELFKFYNEQNSFIVARLNEKTKTLINLIDESICDYQYHIANNLKNKLAIIYDRCRAMNDHEIYYVNIVHGDINYRENIIVAKDGSLCFIDWELSRSSNILYDYYYMLVYEMMQNTDIHSSRLYKLLFEKSSMSDLEEMIKSHLDIEIPIEQIRDYYYVSILDIILYKILIIKKKRLKDAISSNDIADRFVAIESFVDKVLFIERVGANN